MSHNRSPLYYVWYNMFRYCRENKYYAGVSVCADWKAREAFEAWATTHGWRRGLMLTRRDKSADFSPENCVLVPIAEANGMRRCVRRLPDGRSARDIVGPHATYLEHVRAARRMFEANWDPDSARVLPPLSLSESGLTSYYSENSGLRHAPNTTIERRIA